MANVAKVLGKTRKGGSETLVELDDSGRTKVWRPTSSVGGSSGGSSNSSGGSSKPVSKSLAQYLESAKQEGRFENLSGDARAQAERSFQNEQFAKNQFAKVKSAQEEARRLQQEKENRLRQFVDPVLEKQRAVAEGLRNRTDLEDFFNQLSEERGVNDQIDRIRGLGQETGGVLELLRQLPEDVNQRTERGLVTEAQRRQIEARERQPLQQELASLANLQEGERAGLNEAMQSIQRSLQLRQLQESRELEPLRAELEFAGINLDRARQDEASRLQTLLAGFTSDQQAALQEATAMINQRMQGESQLQQQLMQEMQETFAAGQQRDQQAFTRAENERTRQENRQTAATQFDRDKELKRLAASLSKTGGGGGGGGTLFERLLAGLDPQQRQNAIFEKLGISGNSGSGIPGLNFQTDTFGLGTNELFSNNTQASTRRLQFEKDNDGLNIDPALLRALTP